MEIRNFSRILWLIVGLSAGLGSALGEEGEPSTKKWKKGTGWGWVWGPNDEVGALNEMTDASRLAAVRLVQEGKVFDLGITYDRTSYKWPGHSPAEILSFRTPEGTKRQADLSFVDNPSGTAWHSCALFINDNVATQIDSLAHATEGSDNHWYNGFQEQDFGGDWGPRRCDATTIPPVVARGVLIDVAGHKGVPVLPSHYRITVEDLRAALAAQKTELRPGDVVLIRTGTLQFWGKSGSDHAKIGQHDSVGIGLEEARWLVEQKGTMMIGSDTSGLEWQPSPDEVEAYHRKARTFIPVHRYLLIQQGVHVAEFHYLEDLAREKVYEFLYMCATNKIKGSTAGFTLRPVALR